MLPPCADLPAPPDPANTPLDTQTCPHRPASLPILTAPPPPQVIGMAPGTSEHLYTLLSIYNHGALSKLCNHRIGVANICTHSKCWGRKQNTRNWNYFPKVTQQIIGSTITETQISSLPLKCLSAGQPACQLVNMCRGTEKERMLGAQRETWFLFKSKQMMNN